MTTPRTVLLLAICTVGITSRTAAKDLRTNDTTQAANTTEEPAATRKTKPANLPPRSHYAVILNCKPFGESEKPPQSDETAATAQETEIRREEESLAGQLDMVAAIRAPNGEIAVGFIDKSVQPPQNFYLNVGTSDGGYKVVSADPESETAVIEKGGVSVRLKIGKGMIAKAPAVAAENDNTKPTPTQDDAASSAELSSGKRSPIPGVIRMSRAQASEQGSYLARLKRRREAQNSERAEEIKKLRAELVNIARDSSDDAARKREREMNLELISRGQEPLSPIELTPEEDAELVKKGVLLPGE